MGKNVIDLLGPDGNAFYILGVAQKLSKQLLLDFDKINKEMTSGDYFNLLDIFKSYFGDYIILKNYDKIGEGRLW
jgi:hypothetical protein